MFYQALFFVHLELELSPTPIQKGLPDLYHSDLFEVRATFRIECAIIRKFSASLCSKLTLLLALAVRFSNARSDWKIQNLQKKIKCLVN